MADVVPLAKIQRCPRCKEVPCDWSPLRIECPCGVFVIISPKDKTILHAWNAWVSRQRAAIRDGGYDATMKRIDVIFPREKE